MAQALPIVSTWQHRCTSSNNFSSKFCSQQFWIWLLHDQSILIVYHSRVFSLYLFVQTSVIAGFTFNDRDFDRCFLAVESAKQMKIVSVSLIHRGCKEHQYKDRLLYLYLPSSATFDGLAFTACCQPGSRFGEQNKERLAVKSIKKTFFNLKNARIFVRWMRRKRWIFVRFAVFSSENSIFTAFTASNEQKLPYSGSKLPSPACQHFLIFLSLTARIFLVKLNQIQETLWKTNEL